MDTPFLFTPYHHNGIKSYNNHLGIVKILVLQRNIRFKAEDANGLCEEMFKATGTQT
jgi:hypothetical protein